jgi:hypothetical protein
MAYTFNVYAKAQLVPPLAALQERLLARSPQVKLLGNIEILEMSGYQVAFLDSRRTGFEVVVSLVNDGDVQRYLRLLARWRTEDNGFLDVLRASDVQIRFSCFGDAERDAARMVASSLAALSGGWFSDPQTGLLVPRGAPAVLPKA